MRTYSLGMRQRLGIAQALLGRPKILILDEPTNGLDPQGIKEMREFIRKLAEDGLSVFVSSHLLSEIQLMCDRVAIITSGNVIAVGAVSELIRRDVSTVVWHLKPYEDGKRLLVGAGDVRILDEDAYQTELEAEEAARGVVTEMQAERIPELSKAMLECGVTTYSVSIKNPTLEDLFLRLTEGGKIE